MAGPTPLKHYSQAALDAMLLRAATECDVRRLRKALKAGANPNARDTYNGLSALMLLGSIPMALYPEGFIPEESRARHAVDGLATFNALMQAGANAADALDNGFTVLHNPFIYAVIPDVVPQLVRAGASATKPAPDAITPAHVCAAFGPPYIASWLKRHGADFGAPERRRGDAPMHAAARGGNAPMLGWLLEQGYSVLQSNAEGLSAAQIVLYKVEHPSLPGMIDLAVRAGWQPDAQDVEALRKRILTTRVYCPESALRALQRLCVLVCKDMPDEAQRTSLALDTADAIMSKTMGFRVKLATELVAEVLSAAGPIQDDRLLESLDRHLLSNKAFSQDRLTFVWTLANLGYTPSPQGLERLHLKLESQIGSDLAAELLAPLHVRSAAQDLEALDVAPDPVNGE